MPFAKGNRGVKTAQKCHANRRLQFVGNGVGRCQERPDSKIRYSALRNTGFASRLLYVSSVCSGVSCRRGRGERSNCSRPKPIRGASRAADDGAGRQAADHPGRNRATACFGRSRCSEGRERNGTGRDESGCHSQHRITSRVCCARLQRFRASDVRGAKVNWPARCVGLASPWFAIVPNRWGPLMMKSLVSALALAALCASAHALEPSSATDFSAAQKKVQSAPPKRVAAPVVRRAPSAPSVRRAPAPRVVAQPRVNKKVIQSNQGVPKSGKKVPPPPVPKEIGRAHV